MSRATQYFIEFKHFETGEWVLFAPMIPAIECKYPESNEETIFPEYVRTISDSIQGYVRDVLDGNNDFNDRGFPDDMTLKLVNHIEHLENKYKEPVGWGKSYATLKELVDFAEDKKVNYENSLKSYEDMKSHNDIMDELHYLENLIINGSENTPENKGCSDEESVDDYDDIICEYKELIDEVDGFISFIESINRMVNFVYASWYNTSEIRLIFYTN